MERWRIEFFEEDDGRRPVQIWLEGLPEEVQARVAARMDLLAQHGPTLDHPYTSQIEGKLREVRLRFGKTRYRILYLFDEARTGILLHGFTKDTETLEEADMRIARCRMTLHTDREQKVQERERNQAGAKRRL